jgi:hypothetical protein
MVLTVKSEYKLLGLIGLNKLQLAVLIPRLLILGLSIETSADDPSKSSVTVEG